MPQPRSHILTFGTPEFGRALSIQAQAVKQFSAAQHIICGPDHPAVQLAMAENPELFAMKRGFGYWIWKYYLILDALERLPDGDHLLYLDAGIAPVADMRDWITSISQHQAAFFRPDPPHLTAHWTKRDCFIQLECDDQRYYEAPILSAGIQSYSVGDTARSFLQELKDCMRRRTILDDTPNQLGKENLPGFVEHRHDQSVLTLITTKKNLPVMLDRTQYGINEVSAQTQIFDHHRMRKSRDGLNLIFWLWKRRRQMIKVGLKSI